MSDKAKRRPAVDPRSLAIRDNVPAGMAISLDGIPTPLGFAAMFRDELAARGLGLARRGRDRNGSVKLG